MAYFFIKKTAEKYGVEAKVLSERAKRELLSYNWKGNVRELENTIERSFILSNMKTIDQIYFEEQEYTCVSDPYNIVKPYHVAKEEFERRYLKTP
ncbi:MAG: hypothetical protein Q9N34_05730 [Aquificota bacterium]|nr:hypothetical protein [Aquificota bacterium]